VIKRKGVSIRVTIHPEDTNLVKTLRDLNKAQQDLIEAYQSRIAFFEEQWIKSIQEHKLFMHEQRTNMMRQEEINNDKQGIANHHDFHIHKRERE
jgi:hypothetical protein